MPIHSWSTPKAPLTIDLDGLDSDWTDTAWRLVTGVGGNVIIVDDTLCGGGSLNTIPTEAPCFARTGYDITDLWGYYEVTNDSWYFRLDVDGVPGDSDSMTPTLVITPGFGTSSNDGGYLLTGGIIDPFGVSDSVDGDEAYSLSFGPAATVFSDVAEIRNDGGPGALFTLSAPDSTLTGEAIYSTTVNPGVIEWRIDRDSLFPPGNPPQPDLWIRAFADSDLDSIGEDRTTAALVLGIDITNSCPSLLQGDPATFNIDYTINGASTYPIASQVTITAPVPAGTTYGGVCGGGTCSESGGIITWNLGTLARGTAGTVSFEATSNVATPIDTAAFISIAEGLRDQTSATGCPVTAPTPTSTSTPTETSTPEPYRDDDDDDDDDGGDVSGSSSSALPATPIPTPVAAVTSPAATVTPSVTPLAVTFLPETGLPPADRWPSLATLLALVLLGAIGALFLRAWLLRS